LDITVSGGGKIFTVSGRDIQLKIIYYSKLAQNWFDGILQRFYINSTISNSKQSIIFQLTNCLQQATLKNKKYV
jgi:hypothetical protein